MILQISLSESSEPNELNIFLQSLIISVTKSLDKSPIETQLYKIYEKLLNIYPGDFFIKL